MSSLWAFAGGAADTFLEQKKIEMAKKIREDEIRLREELDLAREQRAAERENDRYMMEAESKRLDRDRAEAERKEEMGLKREEFGLRQRDSERDYEISKRYAANAEAQTARMGLADTVRGGGGLTPGQMLSSADRLIAEVATPRKELVPGQGQTSRDMKYNVSGVDAALVGDLQKLRAKLATALAKKPQDWQEISDLYGAINMRAKGVSPQIEPAQSQQGPYRANGL